MEPQTNHNPGFELPIPDLQPGNASNEKAATPEIQPRPSTNQTPPIPALPPITINNPVPQIPDSSLAAVPYPHVDIPEETDLIDKLWVEKAKAIINQTRSDPYNQNKQVNKIKAEYMKGHFNKDIKVSD